MPARYSVLALSFSFLGATRLASQTPAAPAKDSIAVDSAAPHLAPVRVTASVVRRSSYAPARSASAFKTQTPLVDVAQAVNVISRALIRDQGMQGMGDVVRYV